MPDFSEFTERDCMILWSTLEGLFVDMQQEYQRASGEGRIHECNKIKSWQDCIADSLSRVGPKDG